MKRPAVALVLALVGLVLAPILVIVELSALFFAGMVTAEESNPLGVKVLVSVAVVVIALLSLLVPVLALISGRRARAAAKSGSTGGVGTATTAIVIASIVTAGVLAAQVYYLLMVFGSCSLDGC